MSRRAEHRVVVVTGASAGIGRAAVRAFAREGAMIGLLAGDRDGLEAARAGVEKLGYAPATLPALRRMLPRDRGVSKP